MKQFYLYCIVFLVFVSCSEEIASNSIEYEGPGTKVPISLVLNRMEGDIVTKATDPGTVDDSQIKDLWVLQFQKGSLKKKSYFPDNVGQDAFEIMLLPGVSNIYFMANVGAEAFSVNPGSEDEFKTTVEYVSGENVLLYTPQTGLKTIPMCGQLVGLEVPHSGYMERQNVSLTRMLAKVQFAYTVDAAFASVFELKKIRICDVPVTLQYYPPQTPVFPVSPDFNSVQNFEYTNVSNAGGTLTFFLPDNRRGKGYNPGTDPRRKGPLYCATYIELVGYTTGPQGGDEITYRVYPGADNYNDYNIERNTCYFITSNIKGLSLSDVRVARAERANCYLVQPGESVTIPVKRANESALGIQINDVTSAEWNASIAWETTPGLVALTETNRSNGTFTVSSIFQNKEGNALAVVKDGSGNVLWSWHIWVTSHANEIKNFANLDAGVVSDFSWMKYNLGAIESHNSTYDRMGLYYQWGRKDPFIAPDPVNTSQAQPLYNYAMINHPNATDIANNPYEKIYSGTDSENHLQYSVRYPSTIITNWFGSTATVSAYTTTGAEGGTSSWGGEYPEAKTVYDPCPAGYRVPVGKIYSADYQSPWTNWYGSGWTTDVSPYVHWVNLDAYYPVLGRRNLISGIFQLNDGAFYWDATAEGPYAHLLNVKASEVRLNDGQLRGTGHPVRCVREW